MAELMQLDKAAALVGKSEVTLRRLIKAGKIPFQKEKTLTGFIYRVDPEHVKHYYHSREGVISEGTTFVAEEAAEPVAAEPKASRPAGPVRIAVADESGNIHEYWQKKAESYEDKYTTEVVKHAQTREELGLWRGRAEQAHAMLMKLLPAPQEVEVNQGASSEVAKATSTETSVTMIIIAVGLFVLLLVAVGVIFYLRLV